MKNKNIVVIGGGTGTYTVLSSLKNIPNINITAIVASTDSGGSSGILRDEFGSLPVGDFRQCLVALCRENNENNILRDLFMYRFEKGGEGLKGHNFGNLFLTALTDILGSEEEAFRKAAKILNIKGRVYPVTFDKIQLLAEYDDGSIAYGEKMIDSPSSTYQLGRRIKRLWVQPKSEVYYKTREAILESDLIIFGPGDLYTSTIANLVIDDMPGIIRQSKAKTLYIINLVSKYSESHGFKASDFVSEVEKYLFRRIDLILLNNASIPSNVLLKYSEEKAYPIPDDILGDKRVFRADLISNKIIGQKKADKVKRSLLRHDISKLRLIIQNEIIPQL